jgi:hypothetical protein
VRHFPQLHSNPVNVVVARTEVGFGIWLHFCDDHLRGTIQRR